MAKNLVVVGGTSLDSERRHPSEESATKLSEERTRCGDLVDSVQAILWRASVSTLQFTFVSQYAETLLGYPSQQWIQDPSFWKDHLYAEDRESVIQSRTNAARLSEGYDIEYRLTAHDGRALWVRELGQVVQLSDGRRELTGVIVDLSQKRSAQEALSERKRWLRQVIDTIPVQIWSGPADGTLEYCNKRWRDYTGLAQGEVQGDGWQSMLHPEDRDRVLHAWCESVATGIPYEQEERHRGTDGNYRWFFCRGVPLRDERGNIVRWFGSNTDIDLQKKAEHELREGEQRWRAVFENSSVGITLMDQQGHFVACNAAFEKMLGYRTLELAQMSYLQLTQKEDCANCASLYAELWEGKRDRFQIEKRFATKDRGLIWIRTNGSLVKEEGEPRFTIFIVEEITEQKRLYEELQRERDRLRLLLDLNHYFISKLEVREFFAAVADGLRQVEGWNSSTLLLPEPGTNLLRVYLNVGTLMQAEAKMVVPIDSSVSGAVYRSGEPLVFSFAELPALSPEFANSQRYQEAAAKEGLEAGCALPLKHAGRVLGVLLLTTGRTKESAAGDLNFLQELAKLIAAALSNALRYEEISETNERLSSEKLYIQDQIRNEFNFEEIIGASPLLKNVLEQVEVVAETDSTVLVLGETGTGKELIARAIHNRGPRHKQSVIKVDCSAIPASLMESELFGYEKGAFTGAIAQKLGRFEIAQKGTLFLDEIGDVPLNLQAKLLRILQEQSFERLGSNRTQHVDVRIIAATNRDLEQMVEKGEFRADLYYRLKVFIIEIPPLRRRPEDIPPLVRHYVQKYAQRMKRHIEIIPAETMDAFVHYSWPGNVRELQHFIERAVILSSGKTLQAPLGELKPHKRQVSIKPAAKRRTMEEIERESILEALRESNWIVGGPQGAAVKLGLKRTTLASRMERLGLSRQDGRQDSSRRR
jgi:formate hydrogenlyase transcriptional activator